MLVTLRTAGQQFGELVVLVADIRLAFVQVFDASLSKWVGGNALVASTH